MLQKSIMIAACIFLAGEAQSASIAESLNNGAMQTPRSQTQAADENLDELPDWVKDSRRLSQLLGGKAVGNVTDAKAIRRMETPIAGLDALVISAKVYPEGEMEPKNELFVIYLDKSSRYLVAGLVIDMQENRNYGQMVERAVKGEIAESPALALSPLEMNGVTASYAPNSLNDLVLIVVDVTPAKGRENLKRIHDLRSGLIAQGKKVANLRIIPVSNGNDEASTGAMALCLGYEAIKKHDGYEKLIDFTKSGKDAAWMSKDRLRNDPLTKQAAGTGIFKLEANSTQAVLAKLDTLPLVYRLRDGKLTYIPTPQGEGDWKKIFTGETE